MILPFIISLLVICLTVIVKRKFSYWKNLGIPFVTPTFPFGNIAAVVRKKKSFGVAIYDLYKKSEDPLVGLFLLFRPALLVRDKSLVRNILMNDFEYFHDRGVYCNSKSDPMSANIFTLPGNQWKPLRNKITPVFTSGKLKGMFPHIKHVAQELVKYLEPIAKKEENIEIFDFTHRYVVDCLASVAFGQDGISTIKNPHDDFIIIPEIVNNNSFSSAIRNAGLFAFPGLMKFFGLKLQCRAVREFFINLVRKTIEEREKNKTVRKDLMQYLIQLRNNISVKADSDDEWKIMSTVFIFHIAGHDSSSATIGYTLFELTKNVQLMKRARDDIKLTLEKYDGELTYESVMDMKFIDLCVKETLRKYPILPMLNRECTKGYNIPGSTIVIEKGTSIVISVLGLHRNKDFFPHPEMYDPDRFTDEKRAYDEDVYMPFGLGPRNCLAFRMGLVFVKVGLVSLLVNFNFEGEGGEIEFNKGSVALIPEKGQGIMKIKTAQVESKF